MQRGAWSIQYGVGSTASGTVFREVVTVGGVTVQAQAFESASTVGGSFTSDTATLGLLGLGVHNTNQFTIYNRAMPQQKFFSNAMPTLTMPLFPVNLKAGVGKHSSEAGRSQLGRSKEDPLTLSLAGNYNFGLPIVSTIECIHTIFR